MFLYNLKNIFALLTCISRNCLLILGPRRLLHGLSITSIRNTIQLLLTQVILAHVWQHSGLPCNPLGMFYLMANTVRTSLMMKTGLCCRRVVPLDFTLLLWHCRGGYMCLG